MSDTDEYFRDDFVLNDEDRAILDAEEEKWREKQQEEKQQRQQQQPTVKMTRTALRRPIERDAPLPAAKMQKSTHGSGLDELRERHVDDGSTSVHATFPSISMASPSSTLKLPSASPKRPTASAGSQHRGRHRLLSQIQAAIGSSAEVATPHPTRQSSAISAHSRRSSNPPPPPPSSEGTQERDLGAEIDAIKGELDEVRRLVKELRRGS